MILQTPVSWCVIIPIRALELQPFSLKPLLRRAMAYESLERYRKAYVDYKTVLQIDMSVQAAHDAINRYQRLHISVDIWKTGVDTRADYKLPLLIQDESSSFISIII